MSDHCETCGAYATWCDFYETERGAVLGAVWCDDCLPHEIRGDSRTEIRDDTVAHWARNIRGAIRRSAGRV